MAKKPAPPEPLFGRLCLITPADIDPERFAPELDAALHAGDVASLLVTLPADDPALALRIAERLVPIAQANGVAALLVDAPDLLRPTGADGLYVGTGHADLRHAVETLRPDRIVGAGDLKTRHEAMLAGETDCDYLFFGRLDGDTAPGIFEKSFDLAAWWSALFEIPAMVMGGSDIASVIEAVDARIEFVALRTAVWEHGEGAAAAVAEANRLIADRQREVVP